jgi:type IV pilus modification protein PilV
MAERKIGLNPFAAGQRGFGMVETLVAMLVVVLGLLGTGYLLVSSARHVNSAYERTQATFLAEAMAERMRANPPGIQSGVYDGIDSNNIDCATIPNPYCQDYESASGAIPACATATQMKTMDAFVIGCGYWKTGGARGGAKTALPGGRLRVACDASPCTATSTYTITVNWNEQEGANLASKSVLMRISP